METKMITELTFIKEQNFNQMIEYLNSNFMRSLYYFRGQPDARWGNISSSLARLKKNIIDLDDALLVKDIFEFEEFVTLNEFNSKIHLLSDQISSADDDFSKLSLLQHYGAPTRIVDFTLSQFIALYFSLAESSEVKESVVYAINATSVWLKNQEIISNIIEKMKDHPRYWDLIRLSANDEYEEVIKLNNKENNEKLEILRLHSPKKKNLRIVAQQGCFLIPSYPLCDVEKLLNKEYSDNANDVVKITYPRDWCYDIYKYLIKNNISGETLFTGFEGYCTKKRQDIIFKNSQI
jgi:hypothetical protein